LQRFSSHARILEAYRDHGIGMNSSPVRQRRLECGLTQTELASRAGVSRQLVAAVEAGHNTPAVDAALRLAQSLATTVEDLFAPSTTSVTSALGSQLRHDTPLRVGRVGDQIVAAELADHGTAGAVWATPDGVVQDGKLRLFPNATPAGLVLAGCDPALGVADAMLYGLGPRSLLAISTATGTALQALKNDRVHAAVVHGPEAHLPEPPLPLIRIHLARWLVGLAVPPKQRRQSLDTLLAGKTPIAQRDPAAASQQALQRALGKAGIAVSPRGPLVAGHIDAARTASTLNCAAVTTEAAAHAFELSFVPIEHHAVQIWVAERWLDNPAAHALFDLIATAAFTQRIKQFRGYDLTGCGTRLVA
jgi:DNA-binding XRE family transcriptional regulator